MCEQNLFYLLNNQKMNLKQVHKDDEFLIDGLYAKGHPISVIANKLEYKEESIQAYFHIKKQNNSPPKSSHMAFKSIDDTMQRKKFLIKRSGDFHLDRNGVFAYNTKKGVRRTLSLRECVLDEEIKDDNRIHLRHGKHNFIFETSNKDEKKLLIDTIY